MSPEVRPESSCRRSPNSAQKTLAVLFLAAGLSVVGYRWLVFGQLEQSSALFIGLPAVLAAALALVPSSRSATLTAVHGVAILLLVSAIFLGEGVACILMAAPVFLLVGGLVGGLIDLARASSKRRSSAPMLVLLPFAMMSIEGVAPELSFPRDETVSVARTLDASPVQVERALGRPPRFDAPLPPYFRLGFPRPAAVRGGGIELGDAWVVHMAGGEGRPGDLTLVVVRREAGLVEWRFESDTSHVAHWTGLRSARVEWEALAPDRTRVRWTIGYERRLDPAWYFGPMQRYAARLAGGYLIECLATPAADVLR